MVLVKHGSCLVKATDQMLDPTVADQISLPTNEQFPQPKDKR
jgi:hypothetical protein